MDGLILPEIASPESIPTIGQITMANAGSGIVSS